jgi:hypothetical protein
MICKECGFDNDDNFDYCHKCGNDFLPFLRTTLKNYTANEIWNKLSSLTKWIIIIISILSCIKNIFSFIGIALGYFWFAKWTAELAIDNNRNVNWAYFIGFEFSIIGYLSYAAYIFVINKFHKR